MIFLCGCGQAGGARGIADLRRAPLHTFDEPELERYLKDLSSTHADPLERVIVIARQSFGQSYRLGPLGEFPIELTDPDPLYSLSVSDCVTFVEQSWAMALARDWPTFMYQLTRLRYKDGLIGILTRNHFTEADWNANNSNLFEDLTQQLAAGQGVSYTLRIDRKAFFATKGLATDHEVQTWQDTYISREGLERISSQLRSGDIIEFVRGGKSPHVGHLGLLTRGPEGELLLIHASRPAVHQEPLQDYLDAHRTFIGLKILRFKPPPLSKSR